MGPTSHRAPALGSGKQGRLTFEAVTIRFAALGATTAGFFGDRLMAGRKILALAIKVRILVPQPARVLSSRAKPASNCETEAGAVSSKKVPSSSG